jgi:CyaY protein
MARDFMREMVARTMNPNGLTEAEFNQACAETLARIEAALEDADLDFETPADGIVEIAFDDGGKIIVNRHGVAREIWVAARSGGFHFKPQAGGWVDTRDGTPLFDKLAALIAAQGGGAVEF